MPGAPGQAGYLVKVYDTSGKLVDIPESDIESIDLGDQINGGSSDATIVFRRPFNQMGQIAFGYTVAVWFWGRGQTMPAEPYYGGTIVDFDQEQGDSSGKVTAKIEGVCKLLDAAIVTGEINPGVVTQYGTNPNLDAADFLRSMIPAYQPTAFSSPTIPSSMFNLLPLNFDGSKLGAAIDTVVKTETDANTGNIFTWFVRLQSDLSKRVVVQVDQNPNTVSSVKFKHLFLGSDFDEYLISTKYRDIVNVVSVYGGQDPTTGQQVFGSYSDANSKSEFGPIEDKISVTQLTSNTQAQSYAKTWLLLHAYPQAQGSARLLNPDPTIQAGTWVQIWEEPANGGTAAVVKQVRVAQVRVQIQNGAIWQTISTTSPIPYLDEAVYRMGTNVKVAQATYAKANPKNTQQLYVRSGGYATATQTAAQTGTNANVTLAPLEAVFPTLGVVLSTLGTVPLVDNSGGVNNGQGGDGAFTISVNSCGGTVVTKGDRPAASSTLQHLTGAWVNAGTPIVSDIRNLLALPTLNISQAPTLAASQPATPFPTPVNTGNGSYDQQLSFILQAGLDNTNAALAKLHIGTRPTGQTTLPISQRTEVAPGAPGATLSALVHGLSGGTQYDFFVRGVDNHDRVTGWTQVGTNLANAAKLDNISDGANYAKVKGSELSTGLVTAGGMLLTAVDAFGSRIAPGVLHSGHFADAGMPGATNLIYNPTGNGQSGAANYTGWTRTAGATPNGTWTGDGFGGGRFLQTANFSLGNNQYDGWDEPISLFANQSAVIQAILDWGGAAPPAGVALYVDIVNAARSAVIASSQLTLTSGTRIWKASAFNTGSNTSGYLRFYVYNQSGATQTIPAFSFAKLQLEYGTSPSVFVDHYSSLSTAKVLDGTASLIKSTLFKANVPNSLSNLLMDVQLCANGGTTGSTSISIWMQSLTGKSANPNGVNLPAWVYPDGSGGIYPTAGASGSSSAYLHTFTSLTTGASYYFIIGYNISTGAFTNTNTIYSSSPTQAQIASVLGDGVVAAVVASANTNSAILAGGGTSQGVAGSGAGRMVK